MRSITSPEWTQFLVDVSDAKAALGNPDVVWYRGHANADFYLLASLLRYSNGLSKERYLFNTFKKFSDRINTRRQSDWETLFDMQHHHIPTRLLDWSETFGVALFFAATYNQSHHLGKDAAVYLLDPVKLNRISGVDRVLSIPQDEGRLSYTGIYWDHTPFSPAAPIAIEPIFVNDRMRAQRGVFTIHHDKKDPLEAAFPTAVKKVTLPSSVIPAALEFLELSNLTMFSIYPDFAGLANHLQNTSGLLV